MLNVKIERTKFPVLFQLLDDQSMVANNKIMAVLRQGKHADLVSMPPKTISRYYKHPYEQISKRLN